jgi:hypothetical protein
MTKKEIQKNKIQLAEKALLQLTDDERLALFKTFCRWCGGEDSHCYCDHDDFTE